MLPDLDSLALFVHAAEFRNLTRAAEASHITVAAASRRLALLEHQFKAQLFERHSRGMKLTRAGERLWALAREVIASVHHMRSEMGNYTDGRQSVIRVLGSTSAMTQFLPGDIARYQSSHADVRIVLEESWSDEAMRRLRGGEIDLGVLVVDGFEVGDLWTRPYRIDRLAAVLRQDDPLAGQPALALVDLLERDLISLEASSSLTRLLTAQAAQLSRPMTLRVQVRSFESVCRAVEARLGIGILPLHSALGLAGALGLTLVPLSDAWAARRMQLCAHTEPAAGSALAALVDHLASLADAEPVG